MRLLAAVCTVGLLGGLAVGVWFLGESMRKKGLAGAKKWKQMLKKGLVRNTKASVQCLENKA